MPKSDSITLHIPVAGYSMGHIEGRVAEYLTPAGLQELLANFSFPLEFGKPDPSSFRIIEMYEDPTALGRPRFVAIVELEIAMSTNVVRVDNTESTGSSEEMVLIGEVVW